MAGTITGAPTLNNVTLKPVTITGVDNVGGFAGSITDAQLKGKTLNVTNTIKGTDNVGGFAGSLTNSTITESKAEVANGITGINNLGGFAGKIDNTNLQNCEAQSSVTATGNFVGGAVGYLSPTARSMVTNVQVGEKSTTKGLASIFATPTSPSIAGTSDVGGLLGSVTNTDITLCDTSATVTATGTNAGGFAGQATNALFAQNNARGNVTNTGDHTGGFIGQSADTRFEDCTALGTNVRGQGWVGGFIGKFNSNLIIRCGTQASVTGTDTATTGGFAGENYATEDTQGPVVSSDGDYNLSYWTKDEAGNESQRAVRSFKVDRTPPGVPQIKVENKPFVNPNPSGAVTPSQSFVDKTVPVALQTEDVGSGVAKLEYKAAADTTYMICSPYSRHSKKQKETTIGGVFMLKKKHTAEEKYQAIAECGKSSIHAVAKKYEIGTTTLREWIAKHESMGIDGLQEAIGRNRRAEAEKQEAVLAYAKSNQSLEDVCKRFKIRSKTQLREWIKQYNSHEKLETLANGGGIFMTKGRTVTFEEKVEIVQFCMANGKDYSGAMAKFNVSYQQIYSWVRKYEATGVTALEDRRGKAKTASELSEGDLLNAKIKLLETQNKRLEMENDLLKKLEEIERRWS